jgi:hypothetical protein
MKKIFFLAALSVFSLGAMAQGGNTQKTKAESPAATKLKVDDVVKFDTEKHDFGKVKHNVPVTYSFEIKNISNKPVVVENTWAGCGCTTPEKIVEPIMPNETAKLKVQYNAAAIGPINKEVFIKLAGIDQPKTIYIVGEVVADTKP